MKRLALIGCTGHITELFLKEFAKQNVELFVLARNPVSLSNKYSNVKFVAGSLMNPDNVQQILECVDAAFVVTPMGTRNQSATEVDAAKNIIQGAKAANLKHLIYVSVLGADIPKGLAIFDAKHENEQLLAESGISWTSIRCGSYMEDVFNPRIAAIKNGNFLFPVSKSCRFTYTRQSDIPRFVVEELLDKNQVLNGGFNFVSNKTYSILEVEKLLSQVTGKKVRASGKFPLYLLSMLMPYFNATNHRFSTIVPLLYYFDKHGYTDGGRTVQDIFPTFTPTSLEEHLKLICK